MSNAREQLSPNGMFIRYGSGVRKYWKRRYNKWLRQARKRFLEDAPKRKSYKGYAD